jgi:hypothetical protein
MFVLPDAWYCFYTQLHFEFRTKPKLESKQKFYGKGGNTK